MNLFKKIVTFLVPFSFDASGDDSRFKRLFLSFCILLLVPVSLFFGIRNLSDGKIIEGIVVLGIGLNLSGLTFILNRSKTYLRSIRIVVFTLTALLFYELYIGGGNGAAFLWFFIFPTSVIFLLGLREGLVWTSLQLFLIAGMIFSKTGYRYDADLGIRLIAVFFVMTVLSSITEYLRKRYFMQLIKEKQALQTALDEIRVLKGMVPICASCKKIRDDKGFWTQIEMYMQAHAEVEFSHGICPDCASQLFPASQRVKKNEGSTVTALKYPPENPATENR